MLFPNKYHLVTLLMVSCWSLNTLAAPSNETESLQASCIQRLRIPAYPSLAASARISGSVSAKFVIPFYNTAQKGNWKVHFISKSPHPKILEAAVQEALHQSSFSPACRGKTLELTFHFELSEEAQTSFGYPLQFWIFVKAPHWQP